LCKVGISTDGWRISKKTGAYKELRAEDTLEASAKYKLKRMVFYMLRFFNKRIHNRKGFTLIELIVVVAILGILAIIAIPRLAGIQENANQKAILSNIKMLNNAAATYAADNNVDQSTVTDTMLTTAPALVATMPAGPKGTTYDVTAGVATAIVPAGVPGVPAGTYTEAQAGAL